MKRPIRPPSPQSRPSQAPSGAVVVNGYSARWLNQDFCWVYPAELVNRPQNLKPGQAVKLCDEQGKALGAGLWDEGWISVRRYRADDGPIDAALIRGRLDVAHALRQQIVEPNTNAYRLVNAENDELPGLRVDIWGHYATITLDAPGVAPLIEHVCAWLEEHLSPRGVYLHWRPDPREKARFEPPIPAGLIRGHAPPGDVRVTERGLACLVRPSLGKDVGLYTDMRANRAMLEPYWGGRRVLNLFAHTGFFSVAAAANGASEVVSIDLSESALERAEANFVANELDPSAHLFFAEDVRAALDRLRRAGERFDLVILDPPAFSHGPEGVMSAGKDYPRLVAACLRVMEPGGWLVAALNQGEVSPRDFHNAVRDGARRAERPLQHLYDGGQAPDHPAAAHFPEGRYLKFGVWRCMDA
jgi:23S rRNA (cytosine1962-C5)-methyltransferase